MAISKKGQITDQPRAFGESASHAPDEMIRTYQAENAFGFGMGVMKGTAGDQAKKFASSSGTFLGVAYRAPDASSADSDAYAAYDAAGIMERGEISVPVQETIALGNAVRIRHTAGTAVAGYCTVSSAPLVFTGATVPALASATYDWDVAVDGGAWLTLATALLVTDDWTGIAAKLQVSLRAATSSTETVAITSNKIKVTSATTGSTSEIRLRAGTYGSAGGDLFVVIDAVTNMETTIDTPIDGYTPAVGEFLTTADAGKSALLTGVKWTKASSVIDTTNSIRGATLRLDGAFTVTADT